MSLKEDSQMGSNNLRGSNQLDLDDSGGLPQGSLQRIEFMNRSQSSRQEANSGTLDKSPEN